MGSLSCSKGGPRECDQSQPCEVAERQEHATHGRSSGRFKEIFERRSVATRLSAGQYESLVKYCPELQCRPAMAPAPSTIRCRGLSQDDLRDSQLAKHCQSSSEYIAIRIRP